MRMSGPLSKIRRTLLHRPWRLLRLLLIPLLGFLLLSAATVGVVEATDGMQGNRCVVEKDEYIEHDFYFYCWTVVIRGTVDGDLIGLASEVVITQDATVTGDVWMVGGQLSVRGTLGDDVRFAGADLDFIESTVFTNPRSSVTTLALSMEMSEGVWLPSDLSMVGYQALMYGDMGGNIDFQGQRLDIRGRVNGQVDAIVGDARQEVNLRTIPFVPYSLQLRDYGLYLGDESQIDGDLRYEAAQPTNVPRGAVNGTISYTQVLSQQDITLARQPRTFFSILRTYVIEVLRDFIPLALVGVLVLQFAPTLMTESGRRIREKALPAVSWGFMLSILFFPVALLTILVSIVLVFLVTVITLSSLTLLVAMLLTILNLIMVFGFGFLLIYLGRVVACYLAGVMLIRWLRYYIAMRNHDPDDPPIYIPPIPPEYRWTLLALGTVLYSLVVNLPLPPPVPTIELLIEALAAFAGLGALFMVGRDIWHRYELRQGRLQPRRRLQFENDMFDEGERTLGMQNLPEGFKGFDD
jgi:hypothetical protein